MCFSYLTFLLMSSSITLIKKLIMSKKDINKKVIKKIQECGNTDITGLATTDAQPSRVNICINEKTDDGSVANSINTFPYKLTAIIANTYKKTPNKRASAIKLGNKVLKIFNMCFNFENLLLGSGLKNQSLRAVQKITNGFCSQILIVVAFDFKFVLAEFQEEFFPTKLGQMVEALALFRHNGSKTLNILCVKLQKTHGNGLRTGGHNAIGTSQISGFLSQFLHGGVILQHSGIVAGADGRIDGFFSFHKAKVKQGGNLFQIILYFFPLGAVNVREIILQNCVVIAIAIH